MRILIKEIENVRYDKDKTVNFNYNNDKFQLYRPFVLSLLSTTEDGEVLLDVLKEICEYSKDNNHKLKIQIIIRITIIIIIIIIIINQKRTLTKRITV